ncbi:LysM peptidoglycan-binding domain-containing protein [uncultured Hyphomicrobium sp.]|uniref:LysM peptidoglycan-binding domain-containing protein n=1 Tax=uncultured Hyphomicrobium sp. TaxID=194373 RepID=UPI0025DD15CC|nr:LysM peptidoglycan-binding domain-containing protein [uncultured Hyphomicrobium sp.]
MRSRHRAIGVQALILASLAAILAGCSSGGSQDTLASTSLRPEQGVYGNAQRRYPDGSTNGGYYTNGTSGRPYAEAPRRYIDPGEPTPREVAAYDSGHGRLGPPKTIQTASLGPRQHDPNARWQQPASGITTGSTGPAYGSRYPGNAPYVVEVAEGDTLYSLSRRYNVPMGDLITANRLSSERITIGQRLVIPTRYR